MKIKRVEVGNEITGFGKAMLWEVSGGTLSRPVYFNFVDTAISYAYAISK